MNSHALSNLLILFILGSCVLDNKDTPPTRKADNANKTEYAFITDIRQNGESVFLIADYVQFLVGDSAVSAAIKYGDADTVQINGKIEIGVPNDYYIVNSNPRLRKLSINKNCEFDFLLWLDRVDIEKVDNSLSSLMKIYKDAPFILTLNNKDTVVRIEEVYLP